MKTLAIFGAGGQGVEVLELAKRVNEITPTWDDFIFVNNGDPADDIQGAKVMGLDKALEKYCSELEAVIAVGEPFLREKIANDIIVNNIPGANVIAPGVHIPSSTSVGRGVVIFPGVYVATNTVIGNNITVSPNAVIGHDVTIEDNVVVSAGSIICGMVHIKKNGYIGPGAYIKESLVIGEHAVAAMGSVVFKDVEDNDLVIGNPARGSKRSGDKIFKG